MKHAVTRPPDIWSLFVDVMGLSSQEGAEVWRGLARSRHVTVKALVFQFDRLNHQVESHTPYEVSHRLLAKVVTPRLICETMEVAVEEGLVPRGLATKLEEQVLQRTAKTGQWKMFLARA
jgi:hypothetical protein